MQNRFFLLLMLCAGVNTFSGCAPAQVELRRELSVIGGIPIMTLEGDPADLPKALKKLTFIHFWAPWCFVCGPEMESLNRLYRNQSSQDFTIIGISTADTREATKSYIKKYGIQFPVFIDESGAALRRFSSQGIPVTAFLTAEGDAVSFQDPHDGVLRPVIEGARGWDSAKVVREIKRQRHSQQ